METIQGFKADESAGTRLAVWGWTWNYVKDHPGGGGIAFRATHPMVLRKAAHRPFRRRSGNLPGDGGSRAFVEQRRRILRRGRPVRPC